MKYPCNYCGKFIAEKSLKDDDINYLGDDGWDWGSPLGVYYPVYAHRLCSEKDALQTKLLNMRCGEKVDHLYYLKYPIAISHSFIPKRINKNEK